jgi:hypothetical protein
MMGMALRGPHLFLILFLALTRRSLVAHWVNWIAHLGPSTTLWGESFFDSLYDFGIGVPQIQGIRSTRTIFFDATLRFELQRVRRMVLRRTVKPKCFMLAIVDGC